MVTPEIAEIAVAFERATGGRAEAVRRAVRAVPHLAAPGFRQCELALEAETSNLLLSIHLDIGGAEDAIQRLRFWCARAGGTTAVTSAGSDAVRVAWRSRLAACGFRRRCATADDLALAADEMLGPGLPPEPWSGRPVLEVDPDGPGSAGMAFNRGDRLLFVPGQLAPPVGDEVEVSLRVPGSTAPARCSGRVVRVRRVAHGVGAPAGFVLQLGAAPPSVADALEASCAALNGDAMLEEARRAAPRYTVRIGVELARTGGDGPSERRRGHVVSLSVGGAFVETASPDPAGTPLLLGFEVPDRERFTARATVVYATAAGVGLKFQLDPPAEAALCRLLARISARPRRALVVDDDALVRRMLGDAFAQRGYEVLFAASGEEGVRVLASELYALDAVVTDLRMDGLDGSQLVQALSGAREHLDIAVVVVSGRVEADLVRILVHAGADAVLDKSIGPEEIAAAVDALIARRAGEPSREASALAGPRRTGGRA